MDRSQSSLLYKEQWKYIDISLFQNNQIFNQKIVYDNESKSDQIELINNYFLDGESDEKIVLCSIDDAKKNYSELYKKYFNQQAKKSVSDLVYQNSNNFSGGLFLYVPPNLVVEDAIDLESRIKDIGSKILIERILIVIDANASINLKKTFFENEENGKGCINSVIEITILENGNLNFFELNESIKSQAVCSYFIQCHRNSSVNFYPLNQDSNSIRFDINVFLNEEGARCRVNGFYLISDKCFSDYNINIHHNASYTSSDNNIKGVLNGKSHGVFNAMTYVPVDVIGIDADQNNNNILLSDNSKVNSNPQLKILSSDVKCSHSSASGQIDENLFFYVQSRGLDRESATRLLLFGFINIILNSIKDEKIKIELSHSANKWLNK